LAREEEVAMERKRGEGESGEVRRERKAEADGNAAKPQSRMGEEKEENGRKRW
jgi:hypothetical protein